jgi:hypothetical protein
MCNGRGKIHSAQTVLLIGTARPTAPNKEEHEMSDEQTRPEDPDVEGHGPLAEGPLADGPLAEGPLAEAADGEPDVEAHGPLAEGPLAEGPLAEGPLAE